MTKSSRPSTTRTLPSSWCPLSSISWSLLSSASVLRIGAQCTQIVRYSQILASCETALTLSFLSGIDDLFGRFDGIQRLRFDCSRYGYRSRSGFDGSVNGLPIPTSWYRHRECGRMLCVRTLCREAYRPHGQTGQELVDGEEAKGKAKDELRKSLQDH